MIKVVFNKKYKYNIYINNKFGLKLERQYCSILKKSND